MNTNTIQRLIEGCKEDNPCVVDVRCNEPMREHITFRVGGPADYWLRPQGAGFPAFTACLLDRSRKAGIPVFILGGGANIVVSDAGIRGLVLDTAAWKGEDGPPQAGKLKLRSGTTLDDASEIAAAKGLSGLEFLAGMPGSIGGGVWMNVRFNGREIADALLETEIIDFSDTENASRLLRIPRINADTPGQTGNDGFGYKKSPFQDRKCLILSAVFALQEGNEKKIREEMEKNRMDREAKGHYRFPCAGSVFKNNRDFGKPTGKIIDELGMCGQKSGGAQIAPFHGNIIINTGNATAADIRSLVAEIAAKAKAAGGFTLETEILFVGEWQSAQVDNNASGFLY